ncbi:MAG: homoserine O-succinyltransferase [Coprococcus sp.]|uniref:homoserine O-acetyltransferase MetA n=1 Tax=Coprococcus sp. OM04-5BH TaxID=2293093 RepID=UPI000E4F0DE1|nr:homoserine O-succinyltransferase [Coprococcus sp. OM04-5BH]MEE0034888.1 homoserine O-succinyltransferase [Coprococcus sp.]RHV32676.1 homoserine O-succinyltransferase [Coprococcus sp. OM04-5BH]
MPIRIDDDLPVKKILEDENIFVMGTRRAVGQEIRPLNILILNLMPLKEETELQLMRSLSNTPLQVNITLLRTMTYQSKNVTKGHLDRFYEDFSSVRNKKWDGFIITGAPVEKYEFEDVDYWDELREIMDWSEDNVTSTMHICWGAQAGLYYRYGVRKYDLPKKLSGIYEHHTFHRKTPLVRGFDDSFFVPHSRYTGVSKEDIVNNPHLDIVAESEEAGPYLIIGDGGKNIFVTGHPEYDVLTLDKEYKRDKKKGLNPDIPVNYYPDDDPTRKPVKSWRCHANTLYANWLNYYVYQITPYDWTI